MHNGYIFFYNLCVDFRKKVYYIISGKQKGLFIMKKNNHVKKQSAMAVAFSLAVLNATEQGISQPESLSAPHQQRPVEVAPTQVTLTKEEVIKQLSRGMGPIEKVLVIRGIEKVDPNRYQDFINMLCQLLKETIISEYPRVIDAVGKVDPNHYQDFINTFRQLSRGMDVFSKAIIMCMLPAIDAKHYTDAFVNIVHELAQGLNSSHRTRVIVMVGYCNPDIYPFLQNFMTQNPTYFNYVPIWRLFTEINGRNEIMTQQDLQALFERLHEEYYNQAPADTPKALAFDIHNVTN